MRSIYNPSGLPVKWVVGKPDDLYAQCPPDDASGEDESPTDPST